MTATPLLTPREGMPVLVSSNESMSQVIEQLSKGHGPIAIDAERASGYRYSQRAYLIQIFRRDGGLHLIDPIAVSDASLWKELTDTFNEVEWIIHASTQDLPCLVELGIKPSILFDTELGARIAGCERVGLGPLSESLLELVLAKEHSAVDWSLRPLKEEWLVYAALDVDVLVDLKDKVEELLVDAKKLSWAKSDFAHILNVYTEPKNKPERKDPWRRTSGMHRVKDRRTLAIIRDLWGVRDTYAQKVDVAPGRIFNDETLVEIAVSKPKTVAEFSKLVKRRTRHQDLPTTEWFSIYQKALVLDDKDLPDLKLRSNTLPPPKIWKEKNPLGYARLTHARLATMNRASELNMPVENLISPDSLRQLTWDEPPLAEGSENLLKYIQAKLASADARPWQIEQVAELLLAPLEATEPAILPTPESSTEPSTEPSPDTAQESAAEKE